MKVILVIGKIAEQEAFIAKLGLKENQKITLGDEDTTLVLRSPDQMSFNQNLYADYQICIGIVTNRSRLASATSTYHLEGAKSPLQLIAELSKLNPGIVAGTQKVDEKKVIVAPKKPEPNDRETTYGMAVIKKRDIEEGIEMSVIGPSRSIN